MLVWSIPVKGQFLKASLLCICLHVSPLLAEPVSDTGPVSTSLITITAGVAACIVTFVTTDWIASESVS